jgi:putative ABC transport system permease protein
MKALAKIRQALRSVVRFRRRSFFMMLGIVVGITSLTVLNSIGENTRRETMSRVKNMLGTFDTIIIRPGGGKSRGMVSLVNVEPALKFPDADSIAAEIPEVKQVAKLQNAFDLDVSYRDRQAAPGVFGVSSNWLDLRGDEVDRGTFFGPPEERALARTAVLGPEVSKVLFPNEDPLGKTIRIGGVPFDVRGVLVSRGAGPTGASLDNLILIPVTTASRRLFNRDILTMIIAQLKDPEQGDMVGAKINALLRQRHHLAPSALDDFTITNPRAVMAQLTGVASTLSRILTGVAILAMLIGGVVIMSLMMIGVSQRRREIGLRRSVGASRTDILMQFLLEAMFISLFGGIVGIALGLGGVNVMTAYQKLPPVFARDSLLLSFSLALAVGLTFGVYPAWRASRVDPIAALRA